MSRRDPKESFRKLDLLVFFEKLRGPERGPGRCARALSPYAAGIGFCCPIYPLTAPAVRPETIRRWKIRTSITSGTVTTTAAAACAPKSVV